MRVLVHICCGPCSITVLQTLLDQGHEPVGFFFNPNIHPLSEYLRRREGAGQVADRLGVPMIWADQLCFEDQDWPRGEGLNGRTRQTSSGQSVPSGRGRFLPGIPPAADIYGWLAAMRGMEERRCPACWRLRLEKTVELAVKQGFEGFTTSLLYSRHQDHQTIRETADLLAPAGGPAFFYTDFRTGWQEGIRLSREWGIFRQQYCGCVYSEYERYSRDFNRITGGASK